MGQIFIRDSIIDVVAEETLLSIKILNKEIANAIGITPSSVSVMKKTDPCRYLLIKDGLRVKKLKERNRQRAS